MRTARTLAEVEQALALREEVFCREQGVAAAADRDGLDPEALHVVALESRQVVGTCRLLLRGGTARLGRMAVERPLRGRGIGARILAAAEGCAREHGAERVVLHAQLRARPLYERAGYRPSGNPFFEEGIEHVTMEKRLA